MKVSDVYKKIGKEILNTVVDRQNMLFVYEMEKGHYFAFMLVSDSILEDHVYNNDEEKRCCRYNELSHRWHMMKEHGKGFEIFEDDSLWNSCECDISEIEDEEEIFGKAFHALTFMYSRAQAIRMFTEDYEEAIRYSIGCGFLEKMVEDGVAKLV